MASVEELCDSITLINQSKAVLEGNVNDLRHNFKEDTWEVKFQGAEDVFSSALKGAFELQSLTPENKLTVARIKIPDGKNSNSLIQTLLPACTILGFSEILPSMSEIFISAVKRNEPIKQA